jgi:TPP-dependent pyruvate/acetoin dehydrogenase alpha subunit
MHIFDERFFTSAIVSGVAPIALGVAKALVMKHSTNKVWCFIGDMAASGGLVHECIKYAEGWDLPITYVIEDNHCSVRACTEEVWGKRQGKNKVIKYSYKRTYPHAGTGKYVMF